MNVQDIPNFEQLTDLERLELADQVAASVRDPSLLPPPAAHRLELERRWADYERNPSRVLSHEQFWAEVHWVQGLRKLRKEDNALERAAQKANTFGNVDRDMKDWEALNKSVRSNFKDS